MSDKSLLEYEIDIDTLIELAKQDMSKSKYKMFLEYIADAVDDAMYELDDEEESEDD
ncbi:MAG: hypothetical protein J6Y78_08120 [Paludibacteraceae bacterium]|nr:hypothetical protein [Paludibacteraceae bacterium]